MAVRMGNVALPDEEMSVVPGGTIQMSQQGKVLQNETYLAGPTGIAIVATGLPKLKPLHPPLTLVALPIEEEKVISWQGTMGEGASTYAGQGWSRATRRESVATPAGVFAAWRVDTCTELTLGDKRERVHLSRWLSPGIGIVRLRMISEGQIVIKELKKLPIVETNRVK